MFPETCKIHSAYTALYFSQKGEIEQIDQYREFNEEIG
jgi:hypothetical protein